MGFGAYLSLTRVYTTWLLYLMFSFICILIRNIIWWLNGTRKQIEYSRKPENYATSGHKMTIIFQHRLDEFVESRLSDSILMHHSFVPPEYVLRDDVHLMQVTENDAIFVQIKKGARGPDEYSFCILGYTMFAKHVITMPLYSFNKLVDAMDRTDAKIIFLQNQARCGGTLFTEVFKATDRCITYCEPHPINGACKLHYIHNTWDKSTTIAMLRRIVCLYCKPKLSSKDKTLAYVIKPTAMSMICADLLQEAIPEATQFFIYRHPLEVALSLRRVGEALPSLRLLYHLPNIPKMSSPLLCLLGYCDVDYRGWTPKESLMVEWGYRLAGATMRYYTRYREQGVRIHGIRYAIFRDNQLAVTEKIFETCGLSATLASKGTDAFSRDSQEETPISREKLNKLMPVHPKVTPAARRAVKEMSAELGVPGPDEFDDQSFVLPGSLTP